jgi:hypothetical protein
MLWPEFAKTSHAQELQGPAYCAGKDFYSALHPTFAACHKSIQVRATDQRCLGAHGNGGNDVGTGHYAGVEPDLCAVANRGDDFGEETKRHWGTVKLTAPVVGQDDRVRAG